MGKIIFDITILAVSGILWFLLATAYRGIIKKYYLYALFGYLLYSASLIILLFHTYSYMLNSMVKHSSMMFLAVISIYYLLRVLKKCFDFRDALIIPQLVNLLTIAILFVYGR